MIPWNQHTSLDVLGNPTDEPNEFKKSLTAIKNTTAIYGLFRNVGYMTKGTQIVAEDTALMTLVAVMILEKIETMIENNDDTDK